MTPKTAHLSNIVKTRGVDMTGEVPEFAWERPVYRIMRKASEATGISIDSMRRRYGARARAIQWARRAVVLAASLDGHSLGRIAIALDRRDHTTIMYLRNRAAAEIEHDADFRALVDHLRSEQA